MLYIYRMLCGRWSAGYTERMKEQFNSYIIVLIILVLAAGVTWAILKVANKSTDASANSSEAKYAPLQQSILDNPL